jgi:hypothetical protein
MSGILEKWTKQPGETLDFDISFADWLAARADTIASHTVTVEAGLTKELSTALNGVVKVWFSGGTDGQTYKVTVTVTTVGGRVKHAEITIKVKEI